MSKRESLKAFKEKICKNCKNQECEKGIVTIKYKDMLQIKCCNYIPSETESNKEQQEQEREVIKYYHERNKRNEKKMD